MKKTTKIFLALLCVAVLATASVVGVLAYLTDRDAETNVFTMGNVTIDLQDGFTDGTRLMPGTTITKPVTITNTGDNDAWVWYTVSLGKLPAAAVSYTAGSGWNQYKGAELYPNVLKAGESVTVNVSVSMNPAVDLDPDGNMFLINGGVVTDLGFNVSNGAPLVHLNAYGIQTENLATAEAAYDAYVGQWGKLNGEAPVVGTVTEVATAEEFSAAMTNGGVVLLTDDITLEDEPITVAAGANTTLNLNGHTLSAENTRTATSNYMIDVKGGELTVNNGTITMKHTGTNMGWNGATTIFDVTAGGVLNLQNTKVINQGGTDMNFAVHLNNWGAATLNANNCVFEGTYCAVRVFNSGYDMNNVTITNSNLKGSSSAFWVHNYTAADFGASYDATAIDARLNLNIYDNGNAFECDKAPVRFGFTNSVRFNADGTQAE